jgi:hypothetical protein
MQAIVEGRENIRTTAEEDRACEAAILHYVLSLHPTPLTVADLIRELGGEESFGQRDAIERAPSATSSAAASCIAASRSSCPAAPHCALTS